MMMGGLKAFGNLYLNSPPLMMPNRRPFPPPIDWLTSISPRLNSENQSSKLIQDYLKLLDLESFFCGFKLFGRFYKMKDETPKVEKGILDGNVNLQTHRDSKLSAIQDIMIFLN